MKTAITHTADVELVRGGTEADVARLLALGGRIVARGERITAPEIGEMGATIQAPYALVRLSRRRVLVILAQPPVLGMSQV